MTKDNSRFEYAYSKIFDIPEFQNPKKRSEFLGEMPDLEKYNKSKKKTQNCLPENGVLNVGYQEPLLMNSQEYHQFRKYNLLKWLSQSNFLVGKRKQASNYLDEADAVRNQIVLSNSRLAIALASKYKKTGYWDDIVSEAYVSLMKTVDYFDYRMGYKFSTYATWAVRQNLYRFVKKFKSNSVALGKIDVACNSIPEIQYEIDTIHFEQMIKHLPDREKKVIRGRFLHDQTLNMVAESIAGNKTPVCKERIRQIEARALDKVRERLQNKNSA